MTAVVIDLEPPTALHGADGDLVWIRIGVDARHLEEVLEAVADLPFPINPEIRHAARTSWVEFPAYSGRVAEVRAALRSAGLSEDGCMQVSDILGREP